MQSIKFRTRWAGSILAIAALPLLGGVAIPAAQASASNTRVDAWGTLEVSAANWLGGAGVDVYSNGATASGPSPDRLNYVNVTGVGSVQSGIKWQCVELVNRLYLTRGWIKSRWAGNGNQMYGNAPAGLAKQPNGAITYLNPGDVVGFDDGGLGHVAIVNSVSGTTVQLVNQNTSAVYSTLTFSNKTLGKWGTYSVQGVVHAPGSATYPDNTLLSATDNGEVYVVAGGAPLYVSNWAAVAGPRPTVAVPRSTINAMRQFPADGTVVSVAAGYVYRFAGGAPIYVSNFAAIGGVQPTALVDQGAIDNAGQASPWNHVRRYPADGTVVSVAAGYVYRFAGGAPIYVSNFAAIGNVQPTVVIDQAAIDNADQASPWNHVRRYPADGTVVSVAAGYVYRFAGGAPIYVSNFAAIGNVQPTVVIDQTAIDNADQASPWNHVRWYPADGTKLRAGATGSYFNVVSGSPTQTSVASGATIVDPAAIANRGAGGVWSHLR